MQGDIYRAKQKDRERLKDRPSFSQILTGVDDMRINDLIDVPDYQGKYYDEEEVLIHYATLRCIRGCIM